MRRKGPRRAVFHVAKHRLLEFLRSSIGTLRFGDDWLADLIKASSTQRKNHESWDPPPHLLFTYEKARSAKACGLGAH